MLYFIAQIVLYHRGSQTKNFSRPGMWSQGLMRRPWRGAAHWLAPRGFLSLLSSIIQNHLTRIVPLTMTRTLSYQLFTKKMPSQVSPQANLMEALS